MMYICEKCENIQKYQNGGIKFFFSFSWRRRLLTWSRGRHSCHGGDSFSQCSSPWSLPCQLELLKLGQVSKSGSMSSPRLSMCICSWVNQSQIHLSVNT